MEFERSLNRVDIFEDGCETGMTGVVLFALFTGDAFFKIPVRGSSVDFTGEAVAFKFDWSLAIGETDCTLEDGFVFDTEGGLCWVLLYFKLSGDGIVGVISVTTLGN